MSLRALALEEPSKTQIDRALKAIRTALHEHFWVHDAVRTLAGEEPEMAPSDEELAALLDLYVRPALRRPYQVAVFGDARDNYAPDEKLFEVATAIGVTCGMASYPPLDNIRMLAGLRQTLTEILAPH